MRVVHGRIQVETDLTSFRAETSIEVGEVGTGGLRGAAVGFPQALTARRFLEESEAAAHDLDLALQRELRL